MKNINLTNINKSICLIAGMFLFSTCVFAEVVVVANKKVSSKSLSAANLQKIYLGKMRTYPGGGKIKPVDQAPGNSSHTKFYAKVVKKDPNQLKAYWSKLIFSGKGKPPKQFDGDAAVKSYVAKTPGAIGYINRKAVDKSVKVLFKIK